jgi:hypothetical protein
MEMNIQITNGMTEADRKQLRDGLVWTHAGDDHWWDGQWCITLKTRALTLRFLVPKAAEPMSVAIEAR